MYSGTLTKEIQSIIEKCKLECTVEQFQDKVDWYDISMHQKLCEEFIEKFQDKVDWFWISKKQKLSEKFIEKFQNKVDWYWISANQKLSEKFIEKFQDKVSWVSWGLISKYQKLSEEFIEKFQDKVNWDWISKYQKLSEGFIEKFQDKVCWDLISEYQKLSEAFIEKFQDKVYWSCISQYQKLSEEFIEKFQDKVDWYYISEYQKLSKGFRNKHNIHIPKNSWLYTLTKKKLEYINKNTNYEVVDNKYIIAFKGIRSDNYSKFNFQYKYEIGKTYESHCDCNLDNENSFGLSAWTFEKAKEYCSEKIIKVKIYIKDIGAIVHEGNKIRCFKFKVLEELTNQT